MKSGYDMPPPETMTRLEWERELVEFETHLTPELRAMLPSVRSRQEPLANLKTAQPIADLLKSRFQAETSSDTLKVREKYFSIDLQFDYFRQNQKLKAIAKKLCKRRDLAILLEQNTIGIRQSFCANISMLKIPIQALKWLVRLNCKNAFLSRKFLPNWIHLEI